MMVCVRFGSSSVGRSVGRKRFSAYKVRGEHRSLTTTISAEVLDTRAVRARARSSSRSRFVSSSVPASSYAQWQFDMTADRFLIVCRPYGERAGEIIATNSSLECHFQGAVLTELWWRDS